MYLVFDTETTDKANFNRPPEDSCQPRLVQLAAMLLDERFVPCAEFALLVKNGIPSEPGALSTHGKTEAMRERYGLTEDTVLDLFRSLLLRADVLVAHNVQFDSIVIGRAFAVAGMAVAPPKTVRCTMKEMTPVCRLPGRAGDFKWPTLQEAHTHAFGQGFTGAHDAMADVRACARVLQWLVEKGEPAKAPAPLDTPIPPALPPYGDASPMPFGKYTGVRLENVPADYLHFLWTKRPISDKRLEDYIRSNLSALKQEFPDGIWS